MHAAERREQKTAGPKPRKRALNSTAANKRTKGWRCNTGKKVQTLSATHTASAAPMYCAGAECRFLAIQLFRLTPVPDMVQNEAGSSFFNTLDPVVFDQAGKSGL